MERDLNELTAEMHVAVPTAFFEDESLDVPNTINHIKHLQKQGIGSVLVSGTTGEQHSMDLDEKVELISALEDEKHLMKDIEIIFGIASIRQKEAEQLAERVKNTEIAAVMIGFPPYIIPSQDEAMNYAKEIIEISEKPALLYNNPGRTGFDLSVESIVELSWIDNVIGIKDAGNRDKMKKIKEKMKKDFHFYAGGEIDLREKIAYGYNRLSSIAGNCYPDEIAEWFQQLVRGGTVPEDLRSTVDHIMDEIYDGNAISNVKKNLNEQGRTMGICRSPVGTIGE